MIDQFDIVIIGGGLVGASLAAALADTTLDIAVVESHPFDSSLQPSYDERTVALTYSARQIYSGIGIWSDIAAAGAEPIKDIHVSNQGHFGMTRLSHTDVETEALGYVVPTRTIGKILHQHIEQATNITLISPANAEELSADKSKAVLTVKQADQQYKISSSLLVIADGGRSRISQKFIGNQSKYQQQALLAIVTSDNPHGGRAYERFTPEGPLALLPHSDQRYAVVWTCKPDLLEQRTDYSDDEFISALQVAFGDRAGNFSQPSPRKSYPLSRSQIQNPISNRAVVIGNAAHIVHPVAGQGFNLGLRDVASLAELIYHDALECADIGSQELLQRYIDDRRRDTFMVRQFTHGLIELFSSEQATTGFLRNLALGSFELLPRARKQVLTRTMGLHGQQTTLGLGLPLNTLGQL